MERKVPKFPKIKWEAEDLSTRRIVMGPHLARPASLRMIDRKEHVEMGADKNFDSFKAINLLHLNSHLLTTGVPCSAKSGAETKAEIIPVERNF